MIATPTALRRRFPTTSGAVGIAALSTLDYLNAAAAASLEGDDLTLYLRLAAERHRHAVARAGVPCGRKRRFMAENRARNLQLAADLDRLAGLPARSASARELRDATAERIMRRSVDTAHASA